MALQAWSTVRGGREVVTAMVVQVNNEKVGESVVDSGFRRR